jgi:hypothetical protein
VELAATSVVVILEVGAINLDARKIIFRARIVGTALAIETREKAMNALIALPADL